MNEHEWNLVIQCAADRDEESAKRLGPEAHKAYLNLVKQMEEDKKNGITGTYDVPYSYD